jgi:hypothetical protein
MPRERIQVHSCTNCGRNTSEVVINQESGGAVCSLCSDIILFQSAVDNLYYPRAMRVMGSYGWCTQEQKDEEMNYFSCSSCDDRVHQEFLYHFHGDDYCQSCYDETTFTCSSCGDVEHESDRYFLDDENYCESCYSDVRHSCYECGEIRHIDNLVEHNEECYCEDCVPEEPEVVIQRYFYNPTINFNKVKGENMTGKYLKREAPYYGVELEVDTPNDYYRDVASNCTLLANEEQIYCKEDASIDGFEIITQPMTFEYQKQFGWRNILKQVHENGGRGYDSGKCGIHVHVTKEAYSPILWWKVLLFTDNCRSYIQRFAQRNGNYRYCKYESSYNYGGYNSKKDTYPYSAEENRYVAINFSDRHPTVEFRIFRSTTQHERFWASIEFVHALISFCNNHGYSCIKRYDQEKLWSMFVKYIHTNTSNKTLLKHFKKRNLTNNALCA